MERRSTPRTIASMAASRSGIASRARSTWPRCPMSIPRASASSAAATAVTWCSPRSHADRIRKPLLVLQGANDPRVIKPESDDIVAEVRKNGVPVEYVVFPDEGHGFTKKANEIRAWSTVLRFLDEHLKKEKGVN